MMSLCAKKMVSSVPMIRHFTSTPVLKTALPSRLVVLEYTYGPRMLPRREPYHDQHLYLVQEMVGKGACFVGGPVVPHHSHTYDDSDPLQNFADPTGAFFWFDSLESAEEFMRRDSYAQAGLATSYKIYDWDVAISQDK